MNRAMLGKMALGSTTLGEMLQVTHCLEFDEYGLGLGERRHDIQYNDTQQNNIQHKDIQKTVFRIKTLSLKGLQGILSIHDNDTHHKLHLAKQLYHNDECH